MTLREIQTLTELERDALREIANIGAGHAATALSLMTGTTIMVSVPTLAVTHLTTLTPAMLSTNDTAAVISMDMSGTMNGQIILVLSSSAARKLTTLVLHRELSAEVEWDALETSALMEAGNVLTGAYMTALSEFLPMRLLALSPPSLAVGSARLMLRDTTQRAEQIGGYVVCVETHFIITETDDPLRVYSLLLPDAASVDAMLTAIHVKMKRSS